MESSDAVRMLAALAHEGRLSVFRRLVQAGPEGLPAGEIGRQVGMAPSTLSANLAVLAHADLVSAQRRGRSIIYTAQIDRMGRLIGFLVDDCCGGRPDLCAVLPALSAIPAA
jgi:DNA-binding transcriptional ArsR family regulator